MIHTATCPVCGRPQRDGLLCDRLYSNGQDLSCTAVLERELGDVPAIVAELDVTLSRQARISGGGRAGLASEKDPWHQRASIAAGALQNTLVTWARDVSGETWQPDGGPVYVRRSRHAKTAGPFCLRCCHRSCMALRQEDRRPPLPLTVQAAHYLLRHVTDIRKHPAVDELVDQVLSGVRQARRDADRAADRKYLGACLHDTDGVRCTEELWARPTATAVRCRVCGHEHDVTERRMWLLDQAEDMIVTVKEASRYLGEIGGIHVTEDRIRGYLRRRRLAYRPGGTQIRLGDLLDVVLDDSERHASASA